MEKMLKETYLQDYKGERLSDKQKKMVDRVYETIRHFIATPLQLGGVTHKSARSRPALGARCSRKYASRMKKQGVYTINQHLTGIITGSREIVERYKDLGAYVGGLIVSEEDKEAQAQKSLEQKVSSVVAIAGLVSSFFLLGSSVTGNAIGNLGKSSSSWLGLVLLAIGLIAGFFWLKNRKK